MVNNETEKMKAKYKTKLLAMLLLLVLVAGGLFEYHQALLPLDREVIVHIPSRFDISLDKAKENQVKEAQKAVVEEVVAAQPKQKDSAQVDKTEDKHQQALPEFLDYMQQVNDNVSQVEPQPSALDKIKQSESEVKSVEVKSQPQVHTDKIEIYDANKGVVGVIEVPSDAVVVINPDLKENRVQNHEVEQAVGEVVDDAAEAVAATIEAGEQAKAEAEEKLRQRVDQEINQMAEDGAEAPVVLIPGLQKDMGDSSSAQQ